MLSDDTTAIFCVIYIIVVLVLVILGISLNINHKSIYEYVDLDNNKGIAEHCSYEFIGYKSGGQGTPVCELEDGTVIQVKQYKLVEEK